MDKVEIEKFLCSELDLSDNEVKLYFTLLNRGPCTVLEASKSSGMNRITVHVNVDYLLKKGLVSEITKGKGVRRLLFAEPPEKISMLLKQKKDRIEVAERQLPNLLESITSLTSKARDDINIEIRYYKSKKEVRFIYEEALKAKEFRAFLNCKKLSLAFPNNPNYFQAALQSRTDMQMWEIVEDSEIAKAYLKSMPKERYYYKVAPKHIELSVLDYMIFDGKVAIVDMEYDARGTLIYSDNFYKNTKAIFDFIWQFIEPYNK